MSTDTRSANASVLIVEDDPIAITSLVRILEGHYELVVAKSLESAKRLLAEDVDLVLLDMYLDDGVGTELLDWMRECGKLPDVPVICISAVSEAQIIEKAFLKGAVDYVVKPFNPVILKSKSQTLVDWRRKNRLLELAALSDPLTSIGNRRKFGDLLEEEWRRASRHQLPLGLMLVDLDHFKKINDSWGHQQGDLCLKTLASLMENTIGRAGEMVFRIGGDEFAAVMPGADLEQCLTVAHRLKENITGHCDTCRHPGMSQCVNISISVGCASLVPEERLQNSSLFALADQALYEAKREGGRNCVRPLAKSMGETSRLPILSPALVLKENPS